MTVKQNSSNKKKAGAITRTGRLSENEQAELILKNAKKNAGDVIHIAISDRTTIELSAHLSPEEIKVRVDRYKELRMTKV